MRYLQPDEWAVYLATVRAPFRAQMMLLVGTGLRLGETLALRVYDVRFDDDGGGHRVQVADAKTPTGVRPVFMPE